MTRGASASHIGPHFRAATEAGLVVGERRREAGREGRKGCGWNQGCDGGRAVGPSEARKERRILTAGPGWAVPAQVRDRSCGCRK